MVNITPLITLVPLIFIDFQNNTLEASFNSIEDHNPVISSPKNVPAGLSQQWKFVPSSSNPEMYHIQSLLGSAFLSYSTAPNHRLRFVQATLHASLAANFIVSGTTPTILFEAITNTSLTSWLLTAGDGLLAAPATFEVLTGSPRQFWKPAVNLMN